MPIQQGLQSFCQNTPRGLGEIASRLKHYRMGVNRGTLSKNTYNSFLKPSTLVGQTVATHSPGFIVDEARGDDDKNKIVARQLLLASLAPIMLFDQNRTISINKY